MADPFEGLDPLLSKRLQRMIADSGGRLYVVSGYRSPERQAQLYEEALKKYGSPQAAGKWVAMDSGRDADRRSTCG